MEDNWRLSSKQTSLINNDDEVVAATPIAENELYKPETYISRIPTDEKAIDSLAKDRNFAYYQLGLIYKEKFKEYNLAANRLEKLLTYNPEERLVVPAKYNLVKIYEILENSSESDKYRNDILTNHAETRYAEFFATQIHNSNDELAQN